MALTASLAFLTFFFEELELLELELLELLELELELELQSDPTA